MPVLTPKIKVDPLTLRALRLTELEGIIHPIPESWLGDVQRRSRKSHDSSVLECMPCDNYKDLIMAWRRAMKWTDGLDCALSCMLSSVLTTKLVGDQLWFKIVSPAATGKSSLCEAISVCNEYVLAKSTLRGFHSGWKGDGDEDTSLLNQVRDKTFVTKDGDTLLQQPNLGQILAEGRDIYDRVSRSHYRNNAGKDYQGLSMTWLLCGTSSLRQIDHSELGERFLDCVIMEEIDDDLEDDILWRVANRVDRSMHVEVNHSPTTHYEPDMIEAMELTGGYVKYLRENAVQLVTSALISDASKRRCTRLAKFIAIMRARPSKTQAEKSGRELASRLCSQLTRLAKALVVVLNRSEVDDEVMKRVTKVALDTSRGHTLQMVDHLYRSAHGLDNRALGLYINDSDERVRSLVRFLKSIRVLELNVFTPIGSKKALNLWKLTDKMRQLYSQVEQA